MKIAHLAWIQQNSVSCINHTEWIQLHNFAKFWFLQGCSFIDDFFSLLASSCLFMFFRVSWFLLDCHTREEKRTGESRNTRYSIRKYPWSLSKHNKTAVFKYLVWLFIEFIFCPCRMQAQGRFQKFSTTVKFLNNVKAIKEVGKALF